MNNALDILTAAQERAAQRSAIRNEIDLKQAVCEKVRELVALIEANQNAIHPDDDDSDCRFWDFKTGVQDLLGDTVGCVVAFDEELYRDGLRHQQAADSLRADQLERELGI